MSYIRETCPYCNKRVDKYDIIYRESSEIDKWVIDCHHCSREMVPEYEEKFDLGDYAVYAFFLLIFLTCASALVLKACDLIS